jgi:hypothetical protein
VKFDFLSPGKDYTATIYTDQQGSDQVLITKKKINANAELAFPLLPSGGFAIEINEK